MKKLIAAFLVLCIALFCCSCSVGKNSDDNESSIHDMFENTENNEKTDNNKNGTEESSDFLPDIPRGWTTYNTDGIYLSYSPDRFEDISGQGADFQIIDDSGSNINILYLDGETVDVHDIDDVYLQSVLDAVVISLDEIYSSTLGTECTTEGVPGSNYIKTFGDMECACINYSVNISDDEYDAEYVIDFFQIIFSTDSGCYTITFTFFADDDIDATSAEEYFADVISYLYITQE